MEENGYEVVSIVILPDEQEMLENEMKKIADENLAELILTTGGTGFSPRDCMPEATIAVTERIVPGSPKVVRECLEYVISELEHGIEIMTGESVNCARK